MVKSPIKGDALFLRAEQLAHDFSLFPQRLDPAQQVEGLVPRNVIRERVRELRALSVDEYITQTVLPSEDKKRKDARSLLAGMKHTVLRAVEDGPFYAAEVLLEIDGKTRRIGFLIQDRSKNNGAWMPEHHLRAVEAIRSFAHHSMPIVTFMDTPGADAGEAANRRNQAHSISHLIAEMAQIDVPTVGIIIGNGYSGGAIPLATANIILSVRDGVFNTIQPQGLASIARKYDLSWQECAKYVGVSAYELCEQGYIDGIVDTVPGDKKASEILARAIFSSIKLVENRAKDFVAHNSYVFEHYRRSIDRYLNPTPELRRIQDASVLSVAESPTSQLNIFGVAYRYLRYLGLRKRIRSITVGSYGRLSGQEIPRGDLKKRAEEERLRAFQRWLHNPLELKYDENLQRAWKTFDTRRRGLSDEPSRFGRWVFGNPSLRFEQARKRLCLEFAFYLYNLWKAEAAGNFVSLISHLAAPSATEPVRDPSNLNVLHVIRDADIRQEFARECENVLLFDSIYDTLIQNLQSIAREANEFNIIAQDSVRRLLEPALREAAHALARQTPVEGGTAPEVEHDLTENFRSWLRAFLEYPDRGEVLKAVENWKKRVFPRVSEPLFAIITFFFEQLLPRHYDALAGRKKYEGHITPRNIGMKDFWNRLTIAYHDLLIQELLTRQKREQPILPKEIIDRFFINFHELNGNLITSDPAGFPGFRISIEQALENGVPPCGIVTGLAEMKDSHPPHAVGVVISNLAFQAGAFDMASAEKFCKLLLIAAQRRIPVVCFLSSGGMQTKEGAGALFSMSVVNDRITRFVRDLNLPIICFGFGDCTGGAQASLVTHPLVQTYYFSGTNMPFAGQIVVPSYLPSAATLSNYLSDVEGSMQGLVCHPFAPDLDKQLREIDPKIPVPRETVEEAVMRVLKGSLEADDEEDEDEEPVNDVELMRPVRRVLIHARGCPAAKMVRKAQEHGIAVVLAQSDADSESAVADLLGPNDRLVCIGGNTPDESYLNALSVIRVAERERVDAIHPGIGFLSENPHFADLCRSHGINFIGPSVQAMERMGNKSNAINTAIHLKVAVVPGSQGIVTTIAAARQLAEGIGYPILIKAVHGGGGKGIQVVERPEEFGTLFAQISAEAKSAFGNSDVYLEKFVASMRHVEVQILRDRFGNTKVLGLRDCTVQRNNQKIVEESGSTMLPAELESKVYEYAAAIANEIDYYGAGTVEFIYDIKGRAVFFMEMNTRLQVEHPVSEAITGVDIVKAQFDIAGGGSIADLPTDRHGYAIEVRVNAEFPSINADGKLVFKPAPGRVLEFYLPAAEHIETLAATAAGKEIPPFYDNMIAQIICRGPDRKTVIERLLAYLEVVRIRGVATNIPLLKHILTDSVFLEGVYDTGYLKGLLTRIDGPALVAETARVSDVTRSRVDAGSLRIEGSNELKVMAPSAAVFYLTPSPNDPPIVKVGDVVATDTRLCLLEAMKLFTPFSLNAFNEGGNEVYPADKKYRIVKIVPSNGQAIAANDLLFVIAPQ